MAVMFYSYGDSSTSPFTSNFLELVRDAIDFSVYVLQADQRISGAEERRVALQRRADSEVAKLEALKAAVSATIDATPKGSPDSPAADCAKRMVSACDEAVL